MFILLPLSDAGLPKDLDEKKTIIHTILDEAKRHGMAEEDIVVDGLVATIGANKNAALEVLETIRYCKNDLGVATICGLSNISFGLPERVFVNTAFNTCDWTGTYDGNCESISDIACQCRTCFGFAFE